MMKKYIAIFTTIMLIGAIILTGCGSADAQNTAAQSQNAEEKPDQMPDQPLGGIFDHPVGEGDMESAMDPAMGPAAQGDPGDQPPMPMDSAPMMGGNANGEITYTPLVIEKDDLFSNRDLESDPDLSDAVTISVKSNSDYTIQSEGIYILSGQAENFTVIVEADKKDHVQIVLNNAAISNTDFPVIYVKSADKCFVTSLGDNQLSVTKEYKTDGETKTDAVIFSKSDLTLNGTGTLTVLSAAGNGITGKDDMKITGGNYNVTSASDGIEVNDSLSIYNGQFTIDSKKDAIQCKNDKQEGSIYIKEGSFQITAASDGIQATTWLVIDGGEFAITAKEGLEATYVQLNDGKISINASDDGINAAAKSTAYEVVIEINGGDIKVVMGAGDTDGLDANGIIVVNGGTVDVTGSSTFDYDRGALYNGGTIIVNGTVTDSIPQSMMGGHGGNGGPGMKGDRKPNFGDRPNRNQANN